MAHGLVFDTGALIAAERRNRMFTVMWTDAARRRITPVIPAPVITQYWRGGHGTQARAAQVIKNCVVQSVDDDIARSAGLLLARSGTSDAVDATVVEVACRLGASIVTSDRGDIETLLEAAGFKLNVIDV